VELSLQHELSAFRLNALRAGYILLVVGLGLNIWPSILNPAKSWELMHGVVVSMLGAMGLLAVLGLRYPLQMLPLLFFELTWKSIWLLRMAWPLWARHKLDADAAETAGECLIAVIFLVLIPWDYVWSRYVRASGDRWRGRVISEHRRV
jgi:hypothetical protein